VTRMIERWFPCSEVSTNSNSGWGSGNTERNLFTWFAARPAAQAKAAVICSLLPWPDDEYTRVRLQSLVRDAMTGRHASAKELHREIMLANPDGASILDPFSGRGMIPLEAARLGLPAYAIDYSPVAVLASELLTDYPFRDWSNEPPLPFSSSTPTLSGTEPRLLRDVEAVLKEIGCRFQASMENFYPGVAGRRPWGYLWAVTLPCQECGRRFPLVGSYELRRPATRKAARGRGRIHDPGQSYYIDADATTGTFRAVIHDGLPRRTPTLANAIGSNNKKIRGKSAVCPFCGHAHTLPTHQRLAGEGQGQDVLLLVADLSDDLGKEFRAPEPAEIEAAAASCAALAMEMDFAPGLPAIPHELIPAEIGALVRPQLYGARTYGDLMCSRQTLGFVRLCRTANDVARGILAAGLSTDYARALNGYAAATLVRKVRRSTRGCSLAVARDGVTDIYKDQGTIGFSYDFFEAGIGKGPGTWESLMVSSISTLRNLLDGCGGSPCRVSQGSATQLPHRTGSVAAVVTDPPYDALIYYSDSSDLLYVWLKRAVLVSRPEMVVTLDIRGVQEKMEEVIVWGHHAAAGEHRTRSHYDAKIAEAFREMRRVVRSDGLVTIVFGHGEPEVWQRLLTAIQQAGLVMTGSWPANTEAGSLQGGMASIETTLTMACRPCPPNRPAGRKASVEAEIRAVIRLRYPDWERWGLAPTDMLMAAAGPAMEVVGRYSAVLDTRAEPVDISTFLPLARAAVQEAMAVEVDHRPLGTFDARTRFALWWVRVYCRETVAKSELRWQALAASLDLGEVRDLVPDADKGCRFTTAPQYTTSMTPESSVIDVALAMARAQEDGLHAVGEILLASGRDTDDPYLWAAMAFLADRLPDSDPDAIAWTRILRNRTAVGSAAKAVLGEREAADEEREAEQSQLRFF
jgi:putative DNA methylase